jgi:hypothetical protein
MMSINKAAAKWHCHGYQHCTTLLSRAMPYNYSLRVWHDRNNQVCLVPPKTGSVRGPSDLVTADL